MIDPAWARLANPRSPRDKRKAASSYIWANPGLSFGTLRRICKARFGCELDDYEIDAIRANSRGKARRNQLGAALDT